MRFIVCLVAVFLIASCTIVKEYGGENGSLTKTSIFPGIKIPDKLKGPGRQNITVHLATVWPAPVYVKIEVDTARLNPECGALLVTDSPVSAELGILKSCINGGPSDAHEFPSVAVLPTTGHRSLRYN